MALDQRRFELAAHEFFQSRERNQEALSPDAGFTSLPETCATAPAAGRPVAAPAGGQS